MFHDWLQGVSVKTPAPHRDALQLLRKLLELIALDHVTHLILVEVAKLDSALQAGAHFFYVVLETAQRRKPTVVNRLALPQDASAPGASDTAVRDETTGNNAFA